MAYASFRPVLVPNPGAPARSDSQSTGFGQHTSRRKINLLFLGKRYVLLGLEESFLAYRQDRKYSSESYVKYLYQNLLPNAFEKEITAFYWNYSID